MNQRQFFQGLENTCSLQPATRPLSR